VNTDGFYDGTISQLSKMTEEGFVPKKSQEWLFIEETPAALFSKMKL
jgi:predicted Rossmann-fold nucleotide-binding protein